MKKEAIEKFQAYILVISSDNDLISEISLFLNPYVQRIISISEAEFDLEQIDAKYLTLILLDTQSNIDTSYNLCQKLKSQNLTSDIPIIVLGDFNDEKKLAVCFEAGAKEFISTPLKRLELVVRTRIQLELYFAKKDNQQLVFSESFHESAINGIKEGYVVQDVNDKIVSANQAAANILGLTISQLLGRDSYDSSWKALHEDGTPFVPEEHPTMVSIRTGAPVNDVIMNVHSGENDRKWISINARPIIDEEGSLTGSVATFLDITVRKEGNKKLKETLQQLNLAIDTAELGVWVLNADSGELQWNDKLLDIYGITRKEFNKNRTLGRDQIHPEDTEHVNAARKEITKGKAIHNLKFRICRPGGEIRFIDGSASPIFVNKVFEKVIGINRDITESVQSELAIKDSEEKFSNAFNSSPVAQSILNLETGNTMNVNAAFCKLFGYTKEELLNLNLKTSPLVVNATLLKRAFKTALKTGKLFDFELDMYHANGSIRYVIVSATNTIKDNENVFIVSYSDNTDTLKAELALKESEEKYANAFNISPVAQSIFNVKKRTRLNVNEAFIKLFGYTKEELLDTNNTFNRFGIDPVLIQKSIELILKNGRIDDMPIDMFHASGNLKKILISATNTLLNDEDIFIVSYSDITERNEANEKLEETLHQLNLAIDTAKLGVWVLNTDSGELQWNDKLLEIYGISREEFNKNRTLGRDQIHPEDVENVNVGVKEIYEGKSIHNSHFRICRPGGEVRHIDGSASPVFVNNTLKKVIGINRDITNEKKTSDALKTSEARYRTLFESANDAIFLIDDTARIIDLNSAMLELFGYDEKSELLNLSLLDISAKIQSDGRTSKSILLKEMEAVLIGDLHLRNWDHQRKDGTIFKTEVSINSLQYNDKKYVLSIIRDTTDRVKSELALKESEEKFVNAFNSSPVAQSIINLKTGSRTNVNHAFSKLFGYAKEDALPINVINSPLVVKKDMLKKAIKIAENNGELVNFALDMYDGEGKIRNMILNATNTFLSDDNVFIVTYTDITAALEAERKLKKAEKDIFNAIISSEEKERARYAKELHDGLGPILSTSMIYLHTMLHEVDKGKQTEYIKRTYALLEDATQSIREISSNLSPDILRTYGLVQAIRSFIEKLQIVSKVKFKINSNLINEFNEIMAFTLYRVLSELINNSIKHADASKIFISFDESAKGIKISYTDDGVGFNYKKVKKQSKGFGLMNLEGRVQKIGGHYEFISSKGNGVKVEIKIQTKENDTDSYS